MSGILLPGQERKPQGEVKIELPRGRAAAKPETPEQPSAPAAEDAAQAPSAVSGAGEASQGPPAGGQAAAQQGRGLGANLLFPPRGAQIRCPNCSQTYTAPVFTILDLGANPELRAPLMSGQINVAVCPSCGAGGALGAPLMVHDPENSFLGVFVPMEAGGDDMQRQRAIGDLTQTLLRKIPAESRKGYLLQPLQFADWQRFMEKMWEFEGVTPEMLRRQRDQSELLQRLAGLANDEKAFDLVLQRSPALVDRDFFNLLDQLIMMGRSQRAAQAEMAALMAVREKLLVKTEAGQVVRQQQEKIRDLMSRLTPNTPREEALELLIEAWNAEGDGRQVVGTLVIAASGLFDYQFLMLLSERIGAASGDERTKLDELRQFVLQMQEQLAARQREEQQSVSQSAQAILQEVLQAPDAAAALRQHADEIDEDFLAFVAANIQQAERAKATAAVRRLRSIYEAALALLQENLPPELNLLNQLLTAGDDATVRRLVQENRTLVTRDFVESMKPLEQEMRDAGQKELADRIKTLRGQIALMV